MIYIDDTAPLEPEPPFQPRDVIVHSDNSIREFYDLLDELGSHSQIREFLGIIENSRKQVNFIQYLRCLRGKFGTVFRCKEKGSGKTLAAKFVTTVRTEDRKDVEREVEIMKCLQHPRLLQLYDAFDDGKKEMCLVLELIEGGELFERVIDEDFILTEKVCAIFMQQICEGVQFMHSKFILHLDMKPENILCLSRTGNRIKLIDFGLARKLDPKKKLQVLFGTPEFVAPEVVNFELIGYGTDMWSVGVICYVLLSGLSPFMGDSDVQTMANVTMAEYDFDDESFDAISENAKDFIRKLLVKEKDERLTATQCLNHVWLQSQSKQEDREIDKRKLKRYVIRRRWQKAVNAILALRRMGATLDL